MITLTIRIPDELRKEIRKLAGAHDMSMNQWVKEALEKATRKEVSDHAPKKI